MGRKKIENIKQIDGKLEEGGYEPMTLDEVFGEVNQEYPTLVEEEFRQYLSEMNMTDLQRYAVRKQLLPNTNRETLTKRLVREFNKYVNKVKGVRAVAKNDQSIANKVKLLLD